MFNIFVDFYYRGCDKKLQIKILVNYLLAEGCFTQSFKVMVNAYIKHLVEAYCHWYVNSNPTLPHFFLLSVSLTSFYQWKNAACGSFVARRCVCMIHNLLIHRTTEEKNFIYIRLNAFVSKCLYFALSIHAFWSWVKGFFSMFTHWLEYS